MAGENAMKIKAHVKKTYNDIAAHFSSSRSFVWDDIRQFANYVREGELVLDVGCGNGRLFQVFGGKKILYYGVDLSEELIKIAKKKFPDAEFNVEDMRELDFADNYFDYVFCIAAFQHLPDEESRLKVLREFKRVVKAGGKIILLNWNLYSDWAKKKYGPGENGDFSIAWKNQDRENLGERYYHGFTMDELSGLVRGVDMKLVEQKYIYNGQDSDITHAKNILTVCTM